MTKVLNTALCPPSQFERNEHGHILLRLDGLGLTGEQEIERLTVAGFYVSDSAKSCLLSIKKDSYDKNHQLAVGQYQIALMPTREIELEDDRTTKSLRKRGVKNYGYEQPLAGIMPRIREIVSDKQMKEMEFQYIACPHDIITDSDGGPDMLGIHRAGMGRCLSTHLDLFDARWSQVGAFAFLVPSS